MALSGDSDPSTFTRHPRTIGWLGTTALAMGGSNQSLFLIAGSTGLVASQGSAAVPLLIIGLLLSWAAAPGWTELVLMWPNRVGGIAATCAEAFRPYSPVLANLTGVCYWWGWVPTCGLTALLSASAIHAWYLPALSVPRLAVALVLIFTAVNLCGIHRATTVAIPLATASAALALWSGLAPILSGHVNWHQATTYHLTTRFPGLFGRVTSAMAGLYLIGFAAPAFEAAACHVGETRDPRRNVPRAILASALMAAVYFILLPLVWQGTIGPASLKHDLQQVLDPTFVPLVGATARAAAIWFMMVNMFHGTLQPLAGAARTLLQLAEDGLLPELLAKRNRADVPWIATVLTAGMAILFLLGGDPVWVIAAANLTYLIGIALPSVAVWLLRRDAPDMTRPYRAPRGTITLGLLAAMAWGVSTVLGFQHYGLPSVLAGVALAYAGSLLYAWRRCQDRRRLGQPIGLRSLHLKLTGAMLLVLALDGTGYLLAVTNVKPGHPALVAALMDIFVAVALLTIAVGLVLPGMISHAVGQVAAAADHLAIGPLAALVRAMQALATGDLEEARAHADVYPVAVQVRDEVGAMAASFNIMQTEVAQVVLALDGAREGLRRARDDLRASNAALAGWSADLERHVAERTTALEEAQRDLRSVYQAMACGVLVRDGSGQIVDANAAAEEILGVSLAELRGLSLAEPPWQHLHPDGVPATYDELPVALALRTGRPQRGVLVAIRRPDGEQRRVLTDAVPVFKDDGTVTRVVISLIDITERARAEEALAFQARHDALTGLPNRSHFHERVQQALFNAASVHGVTPLSVLLLDLDRFKEVNDTLGHAAGDTLLQQVSSRLREPVRSTDSVARLGGDEFALVLPGTDAGGAAQVAAVLLRALEVPFVVGDQMLGVGASIGIAVYPFHGSDAVTLLRSADVAMYMAKQTHSGFAIYDPADDHFSLQRLALINELRQAIADEQLVVYYQPVVELQSGRLCGVEALVRWEHPERGLIPPDKFIPLAEQTGLIVPLTHWVLQTALRQCKEWERRGLTLTMAVNLSVRVLHDQGLPDLVASLLQRVGVKPERLTVEITESMLLAEPHHAFKILATLADLGVRVSIDDFGTGYSSLGNLTRLPVHEIKIDKSFVIGMDAIMGHKEQAMVQSMIAMSKALSLDVVAEGVENTQVWHQLHVLGCTMAQGYYLSRPLPADLLASWALNQSRHDASA